MEKGSLLFNIKDFKNIKQIGEGSFGIVYLFENIYDGTQYAAKVLQVDDEITEKDKELIMRETSILKILNHPAVVKIHGINFNSIEDLTESEPIILTKYLKNGTLRETIDNFTSDTGWNSTKKLISLLGISAAMRYLHENKILHRDLKPENILMDENFYPYITDFGLSRCFSRSISKSFNFSMTCEIGTPLYMAPELFDHKRHFNGGVDVYSFGFITYEIVSGKKPYSIDGKSINFFKLMTKIVNHERPELDDKITEPMKILLNRCWSDDPTDRPTFNEIYNELSESISSGISYIDGEIDIFEVQKYLDLLNDAGCAKIIENDIVQYSDYYDSDSKSENIETNMKIIQLDSNNDQKVQTNSINNAQDTSKSTKKSKMSISSIRKKLKQLTVSPSANKNSNQEEEESYKDESHKEGLNKGESNKVESHKKVVSFPTLNDNNNNEKNQRINEKNDTIYSANSLMMDELMENFDKIDDPYIKSVNGNLLHLACKLGNIDLFLLVLSLNKFDTAARTVFLIEIS